MAVGAEVARDPAIFTRRVVTVAAAGCARCLGVRPPPAWASPAVCGALPPALGAAGAVAAAAAESLRAVLARALFGASSPRASSPVYFV